MTVAAPETVPDVLEPGDGGDPAAPQPCQLGEEPAVKSLLFQDGAAYTPTCLEHEAELRSQLEAAGETISGEVEIDGPEPVDGTEPEALAADTATLPDTPVEVVEETEGEMRVRFPVLVLENAETDDGRFIEAGALTHRALPLTLLALPESSHGGADPGASVVIGRLDSMTRTPGPDVIAPSTGEAFPEGVWVWSAEGSIDATHPVADMVRRRFLRGVSVDLVGMDYEIEGGEAFDADGEDVSTPERIRVSKASVAAATIVPIPAYADAYVELSGDTAPVLPSEPLPDGLVASAVPSWRSSEVGDSVPALTAAGGVVTIEFPPGANDELARVIDTGEERDAAALAADLLAYMTENWQPGGTEDEPAEEPSFPEGMADAGEIPDAVEPPDETGAPDAEQPCEFGEEPAVMSLLFGDGMFAPVCQEHEIAAREQIAAMGEEVTDVVEIQPGTDETAEEVV